MSRKVDEIYIKDMKNLRMRKNMTAQNIADKLGTHKETYLRYERRSVIPINYLIPFAKVINASAEELGVDDDYELYTGCLLALNLAYHNITIEQLAQKLGVTKNIAQLYQSDYGKCVYHYKSVIKELFNPLILPAIIVNTVEDIKKDIYNSNRMDYEYPIGNGKTIRILAGSDILNDPETKPVNKNFWTRRYEKHK